MWLSGNGANAEEKQVAMQMADSFIDQMNYPRMKTQVLPKYNSTSATRIKLRSYMLTYI